VPTFLWANADRRANLNSCGARKPPSFAEMIGPDFTGAGIQGRKYEKDRGGAALGDMARRIPRAPNKTFGVHYAAGW